MADSGGSAEDRTEPATSRHLQKAREQGNVPLSREMTSFASLLAAAIALYYAAPPAFSVLARITIVYLTHTREPDIVARAALQLSAEAWARAVLPFLLAALIAGVAAVLLQTNLLLNLGAIAPRFSRVNPAGGLKRVFGTDGLVEVVKSLTKLTLLLLALWMAARHDLRRLLVQPSQDVHRLPAEIGRLLMHIMVAGLCVQAAIAGADLFWVRLRYARQMRMSKHDVREEAHETEGNPHVKARLRRIRMIRARRRMMAAVPKAAVVVTNPTHYAVALSYSRGRSAAPKVVAKGVDSLALKIRRIAAANNVPVVANPPLARALWQLELEADIPAEHYKAVAEIIAYVWRLRRVVA
ncbi:MAG: flagellar biosynthesis protein FlhB [Rhodopila sp.]